MSSSVHEFKTIPKTEYKKKEIIIKNKIVLISVPKNVSKELDNFLKKNYNDYNK